MFNLEDIKFDSNGLICAIAQDAYNGEILMQAYMNRDAIEATINSGYATYYSRSRKCLWKKGETSSHLQRIIEILVDCDMDCLLLKVDQVGAACHTGNRSCFYRQIDKRENICDGKILSDIANTVKERKINPKEGSYTNYLFNKGRAKICKKVGEEATEAVIAAIENNPTELTGEISDILYHLIVLMEDCNITLSDVYSELEKREGVKPKEKYAVMDNDKLRNRDE